MPLVSPEQAAQYFSARSVPPSDAPAAAASLGAQAPQAVNVDPVLGHELPSDATAPGGFPRADFAIAKPDSNKNAKPISGAIAAPAKPRSATIREQPPTIGKP